MRHMDDEVECSRYTIYEDTNVHSLTVELPVNFQTGY